VRCFRTVVFAVLALTASSAEAVGPRMSELPERVRAIYADTPVIELVTMGIGARIWERHGHIALCVRYADPRLDRCYNYGTANFGQPISMGWGFFRGTRSFWASKDRPGRMLAIYHHADRTIWVQPIPLTDEQEQQVIAKLEEDVLEENRYYAYDHFWDNCTTRVRDILDDASGGKLKALPGNGDERTIRDLAREGFFGMRGPLLITDLAMGRVTDYVPSYWEKMFLPQYLRQAAEEAWGIEPIVLYQRKGPPAPKDGPSGRVLLALVILVLTSPAWATRLWGRFQRVGALVAILGPVLFGTVVWFLAIISPLSYVTWNETCLVWMPFDLALVILPAGKARLYARFRVGMLVVCGLLMLVGLLRQPLLAPLLWPLIPALVVGFWPANEVPKAVEEDSPAQKDSSKAKNSSAGKKATKAKKRKNKGR
jgi:hypothetical protein